MRIIIFLFIYSSYQNHNPKLAPQKKTNQAIKFLLDLWILFRLPGYKPILPILRFVTYPIPSQTMADTCSRQYIQTYLSPASQCSYYQTNCTDHSSILDFNLVWYCLWDAYQAPHVLFLLIVIFISFRIIEYLSDVYLSPALAKIATY